MTEQTSVTMSYTRGILQAAERQGLVLPDELRERACAEERTPMALQDEIWEHYCSAAGDPLAGLKLGLSLQVGHLDLVGMLLMSCETQGEALDLLLDYHPIVGEGGDFSLHYQGEYCLLAYEPFYQVRRRERVDAVLSCVLNMARWVTGNRFEVKHVQYVASAPGNRGDYEQLLGAPVLFDAASNGLVFEPALQATPLIQANSAMRDQLRVLADQMLAELERIGLSAQVQALICQHPGWGKERIADQLGMSGRHLVRKLQEEGATFKLLRSRLLQRLAEEQLLAGAAVADIAEKLGFSDESAFSKAFKRWAGQTPGQYRDSV